MKMDIIWHLQYAYMYLYVYKYNTKIWGTFKRPENTNYKFLKSKRAIVILLSLHRVNHFEPYLHS